MLLDTDAAHARPPPTVSPDLLFQHIVTNALSRFQLTPPASSEQLYDLDVWTLGVSSMGDIAETLPHFRHGFEVSPLIY